MELTDKEGHQLNNDQESQQARRKSEEKEMEDLVKNAEFAEKLINKLGFFVLNLGMFADVLVEEAYNNEKNVVPIIILGFAGLSMLLQLCILFVVICTKRYWDKCCCFCPSDKRFCLNILIVLMTFITAVVSVVDQRYKKIPLPTHTLQDNPRVIF